MREKRPKTECEICGENNKATLHRHHIVERTEINTSNDDFNLAIICSNCHIGVTFSSPTAFGLLYAIQQI